MKFALKTDGKVHFLTRQFRFSVGEEWTEDKGFWFIIEILTSEYDLRVIDDNEFNGIEVY